MNVRVAALLLLVTPAIARAQMTITGRVTAGDRAVPNATVQIPDLRIDTRTTSDGTYNLLIPNTAIRGQRVRIVARDRRYGSQALEIPLEGRPLVVDFNLSVPVQQTPVSRDTSRHAPTQPSLPAIAPGTARGGSRIDSTAFFGSAGSLDFSSALAGRLPSLLVTSASSPGGSAPMVFRGARSITGFVEPLVVVDGVPVDSRTFATGAQRFGLGGFDYGTALSDLALDDVASITLLDGAAATLRYGSRAANGVLLVTTKTAGNTGWEYSLATRYSADAFDRMPTYQNQFGQGLGGQFEFFDGTGGGINDAIAENWGPALQGQPVVQASYLEPRRPDVRPWIPHSLNVRDYYETASTFDAFGSLGFGDDLAGRHLRASLNARRAAGITPGSALDRSGAAIGGTAQLSPKLVGSANVQVTHSASEQRPGTGFDEINPVSQFARMGRQVDMDSLRARVVRDTQINWIYTSFNNPFFQALRNTNSDRRTHAIAGAGATYAFTSTLQLTINAAYDNIDQNRSFDVSRGWKGGYPTRLGRGDFSGGGAMRETLGSSSLLLGTALTTTSRRVGDFAVDALIGAETRAERFEITTAITDRPAVGGATQTNDQRSGDNAVNAIIGSTTLTRGALVLTAGMRAEMPSELKPVGSGTNVKRGTSLFPSVSATYDFGAALSSLRLQSTGIRLAGWRAGNEVTSRSLADAYVGNDPAVRPVFGIAPTGITGPEVTTGLSVGAETRSAGDRFGASFTVFREASSQLVVVTSDAGGNPVTSQGGELSNNGVEAQLRFAPFASDDRGWQLIASVAANSSTVDVIAPGVTQTALGPTYSGATLCATAGSPLGVIVGSRFLRDGNGRLMLTNGLPVADATGPVRLGSVQPDLSLSVASRARVGGLELDLLLDTRLGGHVFSATNRWGQYSGTLSETLAGRDTGMVVAGVDSSTGQPNTTNVSTEAYFHALGGITEAFVYDASYAKLRDARLSYAMPLRFTGARDRTLRVSIVGRNLLSWTKAPNIDPEASLSTGVFQGFEMGQLPGTRSLGVTLSIAP